MRGRGLGNQFLDELTTADVILNVVDASGRTNGRANPSKSGATTPSRDVDFVEEEMDLWLASIVDRNWGGSNGPPARRTSTSTRN